MLQKRAVAGSQQKAPSANPVSIDWDKIPDVPAYEGSRQGIKLPWWWRWFGRGFMLLIVIILMLGSFIVGKITVGHSTVQQKKPPVIATTPARTGSTMTTLTKLDRLTIQVDGPNLIKNQKAAIKAFEDKISKRKELQGKTAALVIIFGEATDAPTGMAISKAAINALKDLGTQGFVFKWASYYDPLYMVVANPQNVDIDIYVFHT